MSRTDVIEGIRYNLSSEERLNNYNLSVGSTLVGTLYGLPDVTVISRINKNTFTTTSGQHLDRETLSDGESGIYHSATLDEFKLYQARVLAVNIEDHFHRALREIKDFQGFIDSINNFKSSPLVKLDSEELQEELDGAIWEITSLSRALNDLLSNKELSTFLLSYSHSNERK